MWITPGSGRAEPGPNEAGNGPATGERCISASHVLSVNDALLHQVNEIVYFTAAIGQGGTEVVVTNVGFVLPGSEQLSG